MKKNSLADLLAFTTFRLLGPVFRFLPLGLGLFLGKRIGDLFYYFDYKHKTLVYANIKQALGGDLSCNQLSQLTRNFYQAYGQNIIEMFFIPLVDKGYINKYFDIEGMQYVNDAFNKGKGVIFTGIHAGSWELSNILCANLGFAFNLFVRDQKMPLFNRLLDSYRLQKGCKLIQREGQLRDLIRVLKNNESVGMSVDQGGKNGLPVKFFGRQASMAPGAVKLALKYDAVILPVIFRRVKGPYIKVVVEQPFKLSKSGSPEENLKLNLQELVAVFEKHIRKFPQEYLWTYRIWKYGLEKKILILSDLKAGHLRQSQAVSEIVSSYLKNKNITAQISVREVIFKSKFSGRLMALGSCFSGKYYCQGCLWCLRKFLKAGIWQSLVKENPDIIISCGSSLAAVNFVLSRENVSKSIVIMRPSILSAKRFDLVIMPKHDHPPRRKNVLATEGALNAVNEQYLWEQAEKLTPRLTGRAQEGGLSLGLLLGGDTKNFRLKDEAIYELIRQIKSAAQNLRADIMVTTSRRTPGRIEKIIRAEFSGYPQCRILVIANEKNIPEAVGGILGLSQIVVVSPESISMISEAASSSRYVYVFQSPGLDSKHQDFILALVKKQYIRFLPPQELSREIIKIWRDRPRINVLNDNLLVVGRLGKIL